MTETFPCSRGTLKNIERANLVAAELLAEGKENVWIEVTRLARLDGVNSAYWARNTTNATSTYWVNWTE